ncbi:TetR/AcrR family transcriptional regulator [Rhodococcus chondri]|uniref:TetR/AcrR family transcriptional regulator n=1 Tax=Rhodococcus chondri TaxID=3065941 RepID=A0ABU7JUQ1_9NOCA|nr:TetR/AcrR family transcriptional regulator [Rhodococcus sp. CC-R104]MEE2033239.1 TetR/AcrR family transcriptional regulator [Rhodococcus sp. CC-R104]
MSSSPAESLDTEFLVISGGRQLRRAASPARQEAYDAEVRTLIRATSEVMLRKGCTEVPKVSEIVHEAGITNQAFYRHFRSRDDVIVATYEQGMLTVHNYLQHRVDKKSSWQDKLEAWIDGVLAQIEDPRLADLSSVIQWNVAQIAREKTEIEPVGRKRIQALLKSILEDSGIADPDRQALFVHTLVTGTATHYMDTGRQPTPDDRKALLRFCLAGLGSPPA